jgi:hypothetical protein
MTKDIIKLEDGNFKCLSCNSIFGEEQDDYDSILCPKCLNKKPSNEPVNEPNPNIDYITCDACKRPVLIRTLNIHCGHHRSFDCCSECYSIMYNHECPEICEEEEEE